MLAIAQFYLSAIVLMLPLLSCVGIGIFWGKRDLKRDIASAEADQASGRASAANGLPASSWPLRLW